jgi:hypothetical protein
VAHCDRFGFSARRQAIPTEAFSGFNTLGVQLAKLFQLGHQAMTQGAGGSKLLQQRFGSLEARFGKVGTLKQFVPAPRNFTLGQQGSAPLRSRKGRRARGRPSNSDVIMREPCKTSKPAVVLRAVGGSCSACEFLLHLATPMARPIERERWSNSHCVAL